MHVVVFLKQNMAYMGRNLVGTSFHLRARRLQRTVCTALNTGHLFFAWDLVAQTYTPYRSFVEPPGPAPRRASVSAPAGCACDP